MKVESSFSLNSPISNYTSNGFFLKFFRADYCFVSSNAQKLQIVEFAEGDLNIYTADNLTEFSLKEQEIVQYHMEHN